MRRTTTALALAALLRAGAAAAQGLDVEAEHRVGMQLRATGHDAEAAAVFRALFDRTGEPRALARLGLAEGALQRWADAEEHLQGALARQSDPWVAANRANLEGALRAAQQHLGYVTVRSATPGAAVTLPGRAPLPLPLARPLRVATGFVELTVTAPGHAPATRRVAVTPGEEPVVVEVDLTREAAPAPAPREAPVVAPAVAAPAAPVDARPSRPWQRPLAIGLLAGAGVALGVGVAGVVLREGAASRFNGAGCRLYPDRDELSAGGGTCADELSAVQTGDALSIGGFVAGAVLAGAGVTALLLAPRPVRERATVFVAPGASGLSAGASWRF